MCVSRLLFVPSFFSSKNLFVWTGLLPSNVFFGDCVKIQVYITRFTVLWVLGAVAGSMGGVRGIYKRS